MNVVPQQRLTGVLGRLRQAADASAPGAPTDAELLGRYVATRDAAAFELLVWRHGAMVLNACRRLLGRPDDADDAFQATFLTLVRRAAAIGKHEAVAGWLHTVACRAALRARATAARRARRELSGVEIDGVAQPAATSDAAVGAELRAALDAEIARLPRKLRDPFVLCYLEGLTNEEAAGQLGCPKGTVLSRLARARLRLRGRLTRRGLGLPGTLLGAASFPQTLSSAPAPLVAATARAAALLAAGGALTSAASPPVAALTQGVLHAMFMSKVKVVATVVVGLALVAAGSGQALRSSAAAQDVTDQAAAGQRDPASKASRKQGPQRANQAEIDAARVRLHEAQIKLSQAESDLAAAETSAKLMQIEAEKARAAVEALHDAYQRLAPDAAAVTPKKPPSTKGPSPVSRPKPAQTKAAAETENLRLPGGSQSDLIHLATTYVDAVRDLQTAEVRVRHAEAGVTPVAEREIRKVELRAAERKVELLHAIVEGAIGGAERELEDHARRMRLYEQGYASRPDTSAAENKIRVLKMILQTAK